MTKHKIKAVLFDLDGTLLDTAADMGTALNQVLADEGREPVALEVAKTLASHGSRGLLEHAYGAEFHARKSELRKAFLMHYANAIAVQTKLFPGVDELLQQLNASKIAVAIVTNKPKALTEQLIPYYPELAAIDIRVSGDTLAVAKPHPDPILHASTALGLDARHCWYVGDAQRDIEAGRAAGMQTVLARYGYIGAEDYPENWAADYEIQQPLELLEHLHRYHI
ncbi:HAD-IA family hydrolase [Pseudidiomarina sp. 1APP75-32.1]|uniref:HAD-IA family hydrolase n=1 Tax=Pseudidiomarina terrestris TaxID=2820060 RepID=A0AAW7QVD9_9GAMM|nr:MULTISPECIES: HAD-IA family hydrolase [unclassified Pseudidiomarina]MDN7124220.1 HAD-IA family hydrolase [Pseudidiomarina sp. 1APP75-32.1]MDN7128477.1 HAD-IA family hydrolase [Pseudidiomarina sp. 1APR75-15]MDN7138666.1 HAD-IA family hydrolase [Pseudidiomarina sp. 1ASP75-14]